MGGGYLVGYEWLQRSHNESPGEVLNPFIGRTKPLHPGANELYGNVKIDRGAGRPASQPGT
jgi:hypothetical protein